MTVCTLITQYIWSHCSMQHFTIQFLWCSIERCNLNDLRIFCTYCIGRISRCDILAYDFYGATTRNVATDVTLQSWIHIPVNWNSAPLPMTSVLFSRGSIFRFLLNYSGDSRKIPRITGIPRNSGRNLQRRDHLPAPLPHQPV